MRGIEMRDSVILSELSLLLIMLTVVSGTTAVIANKKWIEY
jgi:hypothetical protein